MPPTLDDLAEDDPNTCPICLCSTSTTPGLVLASGPCNHGVCVPCFQRVLNFDASSKRWPPAQVQPSDAHLAAPTLGRCPICRAELDLFEIRRQNKSNTSSSNNENDQDLLLYHKNHDWHKAPFAGKTFVLYGGIGRRHIGHLSFHFPATKEEADGTQEQENHKKESNHAGRKRNSPYINVSKDVVRTPNDWMLDDWTMAPPRLYMEEDCHYHAPSRTFHGTVLFQPSRLQASHQWDIKVGFSKDFRFISSGIVWKRRDLVVPLEQRRGSLVTATKEDQLRCQYPLDGKWTVSWFSQDGTQKTGYITVVGNAFMQSGYMFYINYTNPARPVVRWPNSNTVQKVTSGINLIDQPSGPSVDDIVVWTTPSKSFPKIYWKRETLGRLPPPPHVMLFGTGGHGKFLYQRVHDADHGGGDDSDGDEDDNGEACIPKFHKDSIWGNVFCKRLTVGRASYHFVSPERGAYISYEHPSCQDMPPFDDGSPLPTRVDFHDIDWNPHERKFRGTIEWERDFGTSWNDNIRWKLDMTFDSEFVTILTGGIQCEWCQERRAPRRPRPPPPASRPPPVAIYVPPTPEEQQAQQLPPPERNEEWRMSGYGYDQLYVNAAILERYRNDPEDGNEEDDTNNEADNGGGDLEDGPGGVEQEESKEDSQENQRNKRWSRIAKRICGRLKMEGATQRSQDAVADVFKAAQERDANPIDFNIH
jgi:hypothetical protein